MGIKVKYEVNIKNKIKGSKIKIIMKYVNKKIIEGSKNKE